MSRFTIAPQCQHAEPSICRYLLATAQVLWCFENSAPDYASTFDKIPYVLYHFIKEHVEKGFVELFFVGTEYQLADLFTKALSEDRFKYLVRRLGMRCLTPDELEVLAIESA
ncbi:hypothetical protein Tco_0533677 [Tanacetum coccineum]